MKNYLVYKIKAPLSFSIGSKCILGILNYLRKNLNIIIIFNYIKLNLYNINKNILLSIIK